MAESTELGVALVFAPALPVSVMWGELPILLGLWRPSYEVRQCLPFSGLIGVALRSIE